MKEIILKMDSPKEAAQIVSVLFKSGFKPTEAKIILASEKLLL